MVPGLEHRLVTASSDQEICMAADLVSIAPLRDGPSFDATKAAEGGSQRSLRRYKEPERQHFRLDCSSWAAAHAPNRTQH
jgi:hypothetical protein